ncbi:MAG TPA: L,D-transpeptidase [Actinomycetota bacterium]|nr:L,D-transpeptidase [Actinomycetota bacterium]
MANSLGWGRKTKLAVFVTGPVFCAAIAVVVLVLLGSGLHTGPASHHTRPGAAIAAASPSPAGSPSAIAPPSPTATAVPAVAAPAPSGPVPPPPAVPVPTSSTVAYLNGPPSVQIYSAPDAGKPMMTLNGHNSIAQPEAFLVLSAAPGWYQVLLPVAPNGTTGWVRAGDVQTATTTSFLLVSLSRFALYHYEGGSLVASVPVAIGRPSTPTPTGLFYIWASQAVSSAPYTPGIFALNGFTAKPVPGFLGASLGLHGWTDPSVIGTRVSNGCVRVGSVNMRPLLNNLILGTPVEIVA